MKRLSTVFLYDTAWKQDLVSLNGIHKRRSVNRLVDTIFHKYDGVPFFHPQIHFSLPQNLNGSRFQINDASSHRQILRNSPQVAEILSMSRIGSIYFRMFIMDSCANLFIFRLKFNSQWHDACKQIKNLRQGKTAR